MNGFKLEIPFKDPLDICKDCLAIDPELTVEETFGNNRLEHRVMTASCKNEYLCRYIINRVKGEG